MGEVDSLISDLNFQNLEAHAMPIVDALILFIFISVFFSTLKFIVLNGNIAHKCGHSWKKFLVLM